MLSKVLLYAGILAFLAAVANLWAGGWSRLTEGASCGAAAVVCGLAAMASAHFGAKAGAACPARGKGVRAEPGAAPDRQGM